MSELDMSEIKIEEATQRRPTLRSWLQVRIISDLSFNRTITRQKHEVGKVEDG